MGSCVELNIVNELCVMGMSSCIVWNSLTVFCEKIAVHAVIQSLAVRYGCITFSLFATD